MPHAAHTLLRLLLPALLAAGLLLGGCQKKPYSQATPDDVIKSAQKMIEKGEAKKLEQLIYAENPEMRKVILRMGRMFGSLAELAKAVNAKFPQEVEELKKSASSGGVSKLIGEFNQQRRRVGNPGGQEPGDIFGDVLKQVMVDPYGWLKDNTGRLTTVPVDDNTAALMWDGKPLLAPIGVIMRRDQGKWYLVLPTNLPILAQYLPRTPPEYYVFERLIVVLDNAIKDLAKDINAGKLPDLNQTSRAAGEKAFIPTAMVMIAYSNMIDQRKKDAAAKAEAEKPAPAKSEPTRPDAAQPPK